jgi:hypothetical protein
LEFSVEGKLFQRLPFSISTLESNDKYHPGAVFVLDGPA